MKVDLHNSGDGMTNYEVISKADKLQLPKFRYFMRDELCKAICKTKVSLGSTSGGDWSK